MPLAHAFEQTFFGFKPFQHLIAIPVTIITLFNDNLPYPFKSTDSLPEIKKIYRKVYAPPSLQYPIILQLLSHGDHQQFSQRQSL